ncbi:MAG: secretion system protein F [Alcanivorax sp.]|uniref:type II secretion system F family protein n=1 Tax=Alcanivorax sp. TaxID=1872427 RepID=UPI000C359B7C|nr:type II secretion system F family protein [Alcanivorax sp.]MBB10978.1 secretion system protein F [Alcanivorax sp.]MBU84554.1 secretion system protein F [Alcanivorax sp.]MCK5919600.1 type II secretion system F family protein [Methylococcales bacterium]|tara:strand:+ start:1198 stop:2085 length:888 start_codon:yes stop_codon:yes gene_type:complete
MSNYSHIYAVSALILLPLAIVVLVLGLWRVYTEVERDEREFMDPLPFRLRLIWPLIGFFAYYLGGLMRVEQVVSYNRLLAQSGQGFMLNAQQFLGLQIVQSIGSTILCLVAIILADSFGWIWLLMAAVLGFLLPYLKAKELGNKRRNRIVRQLPTFLDYLAMSVQAGTNFTGAIHHAVDKGPVGPLREEMAKVVRDIRAGMGRFDALRMMADRIDVDAVNTFVNAVVQAERTGASVGETLKAQADQRRVERFQLAEKQAMQAPVKLILPLVAFIFPTTFLIIGFPIGMKLWETFQ